MLGTTRLHNFYLELHNFTPHYTKNIHASGNLTKDQKVYKEMLRQCFVVQVVSIVGLITENHYQGGTRSGSLYDILRVSCYSEGPTIKAVLILRLEDIIQYISLSDLHNQLWFGCAGLTAKVPSVGDKVLYFPQGHLEQVAVCLNEQLTLEIRSYGLPSRILCKVTDIQLEAERDTEEVFVKITLLPDGEEPRESTIQTLPKKVRPSSFWKILTASDVSTHGGCGLLKICVERYASRILYKVTDIQLEAEADMRCLPRLLCPRMLKNLNLWNQTLELVPIRRLERALSGTESADATTHGGCSLPKIPVVKTSPSVL